MRFPHLALSTVALVALSAFQNKHSVAYANDVSADTTSSALNVENAETFKFEAEVSRVLDIVVNSLYQNKDVFLRELISNASDALDKIRFLAITKPELLDEKAELEVRLSYNADAQTLTITDSGIGMTKDELIANLGTVANSGTTKFMSALNEASGDISQIGMFGVGFYSSFLVADRVKVVSKSPSEDTQYVWQSENGKSSFTIAEDPRGNTLGRGTEITLHLKEDAEEYAEFNRLSEMVHHYSEFITHPIFVRKTETMEVPDEEEDDASELKDDDLSLDEDDEEETTEEQAPKMKEITTHTWEKSNADQAIWAKSKDDILDEDYQKFYTLISKEDFPAASWSHFDAEGSINFKSLVYMPSEINAKLRNHDYRNFQSSMKLYVRKVLISDDFQLLPQYLSFVNGVIDSDDLPLNVNRETLQESKIIAIIRKKVTKKVIEMIKKYAESPLPEKEEKEPEIDDEGNIIESEEEDELVEHPYIAWANKFGPSIKMGVVEDTVNRKNLLKLLRYKSSKSGDDVTSLKDYVSRMKDWQKDIYFIAGTFEDELKASPFMEKFNEKEVEVLYFTDPSDEYMAGAAQEFDGKKFVAINKEGIEFDDEDKDLVNRRNAAYKNKLGDLKSFMVKFYTGVIFKVEISKRLGSVAAIVSAHEYGQTPNMERMMQAQAFSHGKDYLPNPSMSRMKVLEINPRHPIIEKLSQEIPKTDDWKPKDLSIELRDSLWTLFDTATLNGGYPLIESKAFTKRMARNLKMQLGLESLELLPEIDPQDVDDVPPIPDLETMGMNMDDFAEDLDFDEFDSSTDEL